MKGRMLAVGLIVVAVVAAPFWPADKRYRPPAEALSPPEAGGGPERIPPELVTIDVPTAVDVMRTIASIPHDPNPLGVRQAIRRRAPYPAAFRPVRFASADGAPLAGMLGMWSDNRPRPGVVLVNGPAQTEDTKPLVEIAELFLRNGWHVLTFDPRGHGNSRRVSPAMVIPGAREEAADVLGAAEALGRRSGVTSVGVIGFGDNGRALVRAMAHDPDGLIRAGIAVSPPPSPGAIPRVGEPLLIVGPADLHGAETPPHVRTLLVEGGDRSGALYLSDPHWFGLVTLIHLKHWLARDDPRVTVAVPPLDVLADGVLDGRTARYRVLARNHGPRAVGPIEVYLDLPETARLETCWVGFEGLGRCETVGGRVRWTLSRLSGGKTTVGPFVATVDIGRVKPGDFEAKAWITTGEGLDGSDEARPAVILQRVTLTKP